MQPKVFFAVLSLLCAACEPGGIGSTPVSGSTDGGTGTGTGTVGSGCTSDADCASPLKCELQSRRCVPPGRCGAFEVRAEAVPSNLLIVLDRSCSMRAFVALTGHSKWQVAVSALGKLLAKNKGKLRFGLTLFPDRSGSKCSQDAIPVPVGPGNEAKIQTLLTAALLKGDANFPSGPCVTNIDTAMQQAATDKALGDPSRNSFVLLLTDGKQALCSWGGGDAATTQTIKGLRQKKVSTFVVGFGSGVDPIQLDVFAAAGGKPQSGAGTKFYKAEDQATLDQALASIAAKALGCSFTLQQLPSNLERIYVFFDGKEVQQDTSHTGGWDLDAASGKVTFYGQACRELEANRVKDLDFVYGCKAAAKPDAGGPACQPGVTACGSTANCPTFFGCVAGCCVKIVE